MATRTVPIQTAALPEANGSAMASFMGAGIGAFAMGVIVLLNEAGIFAAPTLYAPAGGVTGRTTLATIVWLRAPCSDVGRAYEMQRGWFTSDRRSRACRERRDPIRARGPVFD